MIQPTVSVTRSWGGSTRDFIRAVYNWLNAFRIGQVNVDLPNIGAGATVDVAAIALPAGSAAVGDYVDVQTPATLNHGLVVQGARIDVADQLTLRVSNLTGAGIDAPALNFTYQLIPAKCARPVAT